MQFSLLHSLEVLERTPHVLTRLLYDISSDWYSTNEGAGTWAPYDVIGHLIFGEQTDWIPRIELILSDHPEKRFVSFDRFAQFENSKGKTLAHLLQEFETLRTANLQRLRALNITDNDFNKTGFHPTFGEVTLSHLLSTWVVHDLDHIAQVSRVMAKQYKEQVGPWIEFLKILKQ
ncbi:MAG: DinB family protein [Cyclobacteriaceae bacterium]|nr:DinB family protein [Cyclobacteriaceae bacterium]